MAIVFIFIREIIGSLFYCSSLPVLYYGTNFYSISTIGHLPFLERELKTFILNAMDPNEIQKMIEGGMSGADVSVEGDGTHFDAVIVSEDFDGKTLLERHQLVYEVLGDAMKERIHALSLKTYTPEQWENIK